MAKEKNNILYILFLILITLPFANIFIFPKVVPKLHGAVEKSPKPELTKEKWFKGTYQSEYEKYVNDNIGMHTFFIRIHNQIKYSAFNEVRANGVLFGKENYLYELNYINAYNGADYLGYDSISTQTAKLKTITDFLENKGISFLVCLAAGKGSFYPEYFPEEYIQPKTDSTNYKTYAKLLKQYEVPHIDINQWFLELKDTCQCMLYPRYGIHWSHFGKLLAADTIVGFIEKKRHIQMKRLAIQKIEKSSHLKEGDYDIGHGLNLMFQLPSEEMCYPKYNWESKNEITQPKTVVISDSFYWGMFNMGMGSNIFSLGGFWYYNNEIFPETFKSKTLVKDIDILSELKKNDVIILMATEANLNRLGWEFIDRTYNEIKLTNNTYQSTEQ